MKQAISMIRDMIDEIHTMDVVSEQRDPYISDKNGDRDMKMATQIPKIELVVTRSAQDGIRGRGRPKMIPGTQKVQ